MSYQVLARKWRPRTFTEMVGQQHVLRALINALDSDRLHHAFLFTGTRGVGKTTIARILAKSVNCEQGVSSQPCGECSTCKEIDEGRFVDLIEVDAASRTKVEDTRDLLDNVQYAPSRGRYKVYLIDEVHMLSNHSFNALLKTLEEPPPHVKFLLATTDPQKLPVTILSRCLQFNLRRLSQEQIQTHLDYLLGEEGISSEAPALKQLAHSADGSMRDALSLLDQAIAFGGGSVNDADVQAMLGSIDKNHVYKVLQALATGDAGPVMEGIQTLAEQAPDYHAVLAELISSLHQLALLQQLPDAYDESMGDQASLMALSEQFSAEDIQLYYQIALTGRRDLPLAPEPRAGLEMILLRMLAFRPIDMEVPGTSGAAPKAQSTPATTSTGTTQPSGAETESVRAATPEPEQANPVVSGVAEPADFAYETAVATSTDSNDWNSIAAALNLGGALQQLVANSVMLEHENNHIRLAVDESSAPLLSKTREEKIQQALSQYFGRTIKLGVEVQKVSAETPAKRVLREEEEKQQAAVASIENDSHVKNILEAFDGQVNSQSIQPVD